VTATPAPHPIREFSALDAAAIRRDVLPDKRPAILRGLVGDWPAVKHGLDSPAALVRYLNRFDSGKPVDAPTGAPMSLVSLRNPDFERYPKFREALAAAHTADLAPGDAIFIPSLWWHHVESLESFNVLVNYWWHDSQGDGALADSAFDALLHGILGIRALPPPTRRAWGAFFEQYVFGDDADVTAHIPEQRRGILGTLSTEQLAGLRAHLAKRLAR
jgi:hypothetical protein